MAIKIAKVTAIGATTIWDSWDASHVHATLENLGTRVSTYLLLSIFVTHFFVGTCRLDSEPLQIFISRPGPWPTGKAGYG